VVAYVAVSVDGYIADEDGSVGFLDDSGSEEYDFDGFLDDSGGLVMRSKTYEQILEWGWPYRDTPALVLTSRDLPILEGVDITFASTATAAAMREYAVTVDTRLWVMGGGQVTTDGLDQGAIDTLEVYLIPKVLGTGVPLFTRPLATRLSHVQSHAFSNGVVKLLYSTS